MEQLKKQHPWLTESELAAFAELPKKEDGKTFDLEAMDAEQRALYYKDRSEASTAGFNSYKNEKETEIGTLKTDLEKAKQKGTGEEDPNKGRKLTEEELEDVVPGYAGLSEREKDLVKSTIAPFAKNVSTLKSQVAKLLDQERFNEEITELFADPKYKVLLPHKEAFKKYAYQDENLNTPLKTLANSYIYENELKETPAPKDGEDDDEDKNREGLETGGGNGGNRLPPKKGFSAEELEKLRKSDPRRYNRLAKQKKLASTAGLE